MDTAFEFLGGVECGGSDHRFDIPRSLHGAFGGAFGGVLAATSIVVARRQAPGRVPSALDCRFLRGLPAGPALAHAETLHTGRSLTCVTVDIRDEAGRLCTRSTVSLVAREALYPFDHAGHARPPELSSYQEGRPWKQPPDVEVPIVATFGPRMVGRFDGAVATTVRVPWDDPTAGAECACLAADMSVGPPVGEANPEQWIPNPNPDLSLRFADPRPSPEVTGLCRLEQINGGLATTRLEVWTGSTLAAVGVSSSLLLASSTR